MSGSSAAAANVSAAPVTAEARLAVTENSSYAAIEHRRKRIFGLQFHPEVAHTPQGTEILRQFIFTVCGCKGDWQMAQFVREGVEAIRQQVGEDRPHVVGGDAREPVLRKDGQTRFLGTSRLDRLTEGGIGRHLLDQLRVRRRVPADHEKSCRHLFPG